MAIRIINRDMDIPVSDRTIGYTGDNLVETRVFELPRFYNNIDLAEFNIVLETQTGGVKDIIALERNVTGDNITLTWVITERNVLCPGQMEIQLRAFKGTNEKWHSGKGYVWIQSGINAPSSQPDPLPSEFHQVEARATVAKNEAQAAAQTATEQAGIATTKAQEASDSAAAALASEQATKTSEDNAAGHAGTATEQAERAQYIADTFENETLPAAITAVEAAGQAKVDLAEQQANIAAGHAQMAATKAEETSGYVNDAFEYKEAAEEAASIATEKAWEAANSAQIAEQQAGIAATKATEAYDSAERAKMSEEAVEGVADEHRLKIAKLEKELNDYKAIMSMVNINLEPKQQVSGYGIVSLPKNAANGQVSVTVKGNTETDEEGNTKSTISASRLKSVGKNLFDGKVYGSVIDGGVVDGRNVFKSTHSTTQWFSFKGLPNTQYILSFEYKKDSASAGNPIYRWLYSDGTTENMSAGLTGVVWTKFTSFPSNASKTVIGFTQTYTNYHTTYLDKNSIKLEQGTVATPYEPYTESTQYLPNIGELRSLPNGTKDEINVTDRKLIKRIGEKSNITNGMVIDFADMAEGGTYYAWNEDGETETGIKGDTLGIDATTLTYQLATPIEIPIQISGALVSYPSGTVYVEPFVADAGIYVDKMPVLHQDLPIKALEKISKVDFETGVETELDPAQAIIAADKLSFTHPDLEAGDIVFFVYEYDRESTVGETEIEYYDSRYVVKDDVSEKFYKWAVAVADGVPSIVLVEV